MLKIVEWPAKVLETKAGLVEKFDEELSLFVKKMHETMKDHYGVGLAANQVNDLRRIIVAYIPETKKSYTLINPEIIKKEGKVKDKEGCLSFPGMFIEVERAAQISVEAFDENGKQFNLEAEGLLAICIQHEIDHLDGITFIKRVSRLKADMIKRKMMKRKRLGRG